MKIEKETNTQSSEPSSDIENDQAHVPYQSILLMVVKKIRNEPFLFVIAVIALLIGLTSFATGLGSPDLRFIVVVIAILAFIVILGFYIQKVLEIRSKMQTGTRKQEKEPQVTTYPQESAIENTQPETGTRIHPNNIEQQSSSSSSVSPSRHFVEEKRAALRSELTQHQRNLSRLKAKKSMYAAGEEPLSLINQIEAEISEIKRIESDLESQMPG